MNTSKGTFNNVENPAHPTMQDIAKLAGVSIATVSHVINNKGGVGDATRNKIRLLINSVGYEPNIYARKLASERGRKAKLAISTSTP